MKRFMKYYKEKKGITLVLIALMLAVLLFFLGMAVDISYMYHVKNQLQVAADAAALGGIALLDGGNDDSLDNLLQENARREAWKFACKNRATNQAVYLVTTGADCDNPPAGSSLNSSNNPNGDIVVGNWNRGRTVACPTTGTLEPFCPANGTTGLAINAIKAWPKMTGETGTPMPKARVFVGQVFRLIGINWSRMSAAASAIASFLPPTFGPLPICVETCTGLPPTPLTGSPPGILLQIQQPSGPERIAWTDFQHVPGDPSWKRNRADEPPGIFELLGIEKQGSNWIVKQPEPPPDECNSGNCLRSKQGVGNALDAFPAILAARGKNYPVRGSSIFGWKTLLPVFDPCSPSGPNPCPGDQPSGYRLIQAVQVIITGVIVSGPNAGVYVVGLDENAAAGYTKLSCVPCDDPSLQQGGGVHLVK